MRVHVYYNDIITEWFLTSQHSQQKTSTSDCIISQYQTIMRNLSHIISMDETEKSNQPEKGIQKLMQGLIR